MTTDHERRRRNAATLDVYFERLSALDVETWIELWAEDCTQIMPFAAGGLPGTVRGKEQVRALYQGMADGYSELRFTDLEVLPLGDAHKVFARWRPRGTFLDGTPYANENAALFEFDDDGRIVVFTEYFNPLIVLEHFPSN
ncbi:MAG: nuclear transport factor 2 family protein [Umezawaea sp.]